MDEQCLGVYNKYDKKLENGGSHAASSEHADNPTFNSAVHSALRSQLF